ncbi:cytochrome c oxidase subunit 8B [Hoplias malabaricus]|uniref:cytochrome c oxidase subunit 8B n=1 Tax=Hoplias malabaricus TaxID=27720 RepID=UPI003462811F
MWNRAVGLLRAPLRHSLISRAQISVKPAKHEISAAEQGIVLLVMFATILGPSGWILANLEDYKKR